MNFEFDTKTLNIIQLNGWSDTRTVDINEYIKYFKDTNQVVKPFVLEFLKSFGGLEIKRPNPKFQAISNTFLIDPIEGSYSMDSKRREYYENWLNKSLCIVGFDDNSTLLIAPDEEVYTTFDDTVLRIGSSIQDATIQNFCHHRPSKMIPKSS